MRTRHTRFACGASLAVLALVVLGATVPGVTLTFDDDVPGGAPRGFVFAATRQALPGTWEVRASGPHHYLAHDANPTAMGLSMAVITSAAPANLRETVRIRLVGGNRLGGVVWRYRDAANFYAAGIDLQKHEALLHRVTGGSRVQLDRVGDLNVDPDMWHTLSVAHHDDQILIHLDGIAILRARDRTFDSGQAGVGAGGAATIWYSDLRIDEYAEPRR